MKCESENNEHYSYEPGQEDEDTSDTDLSDISDDEEASKCVNEWKYFTDPFSDHRKKALMKFKGGIEISPVVLLSNANSLVCYFEIDFEKLSFVYANGQNKELAYIFKTFII